MSMHIKDTGTAGKQFFAANEIYFFAGLIALGVFFLGNALYTLRGTSVITHLQMVDLDAFKSKQGSGAETMALQIAIFYGIIIADQVIFGLLIKYIPFNVSAIEYYFYYITAGLTEEIVFRLAILNVIEFNLGYLNKKIAPHVAVIISGTLFGLVHIAIYGYSTLLVLSVLFGGIILGYAYVATDNFIVNSSVHMINNLSAVILLNPKTVIESFVGNGSIAMNDKMAIVLLILNIAWLAMIGIYKMKKNTKNNEYIETPEEETINDDKNKKKHFIMMMLILVIIICCLLLAVFYINRFYPSPSNWFWM